VDDRDPADYSAACLEGSINIPASSSFESWVGGVLDPARPILLVSAAGREGITGARLARVGFREVGAYLDGGMEALEGRPTLIRRHRRLSFAALGMRLVSGSTLLLDTRGRGLAVGPEVCAFQVSLERLRLELDSIARGPDILVVDDTPYRSSAAASFLRTQGFDRVTEVAGGLALWGRPHD
jgi:hydroxyacylglutathione hydrolase